MSQEPGAVHKLAGKSAAGQAIFATPIKLQAPGTGKTKTARIWTYVRAASLVGCRSAGDLVQVHHRPQGPASDDLSRRLSRLGPCRRLFGFDDLYRSGGSREVACLAHIRRKFVDIVQSQASPIAEKAIMRIAGLYAVEKNPQPAARTPRSTSAGTRHTDPRRPRGLARSPTATYFRQVPSSPRRSATP